MDNKSGLHVAPDVTDNHAFPISVMARPERRTELQQRAAGSERALQSAHEKCEMEN